ncbi:hypothetical protein [Candidatus Frankia alpina]|uniref:hypothetical protein n=1 Tax=Candidatus Frankia alpina TaxID=2699483 RepID=UPI001F44221F|nr:hypothetical protein [Candidatus Frankia alpina]
MDDDADLAARVRRGDRQAFDDLYDLYADDVFSMCLLILGDPTVARAAAGTAFALVARTRLNPLSDPARLRSWLLELARGSALAWSGSPQARSIPVPHGVPPEELLVGAVVPAPASLRVGLARTFDRAVAVAEAAAASRRAAMPAAPVVPAAAQKISLVKAPAEPAVPLASDAAETLIAPAVARSLPLMRMDAETEAADAVSTSGRWILERHSRPAIAAAAAIAAAVVSLTAAMNWPSSNPRLLAENGVAVVSPQRSLDMVRPATAPAAPSGGTATTPTVVPTVAGAFTSRATAPKAAGTTPPGGAHRSGRTQVRACRRAKRQPHPRGPGGTLNHGSAHHLTEALDQLRCVRNRFELRDHPADHPAEDTDTPADSDRPTAGERTANQRRAGTHDAAGQRCPAPVRCALEPPAVRWAIDGRELSRRRRHRQDWRHRLKRHRAVQA